MKHTFVALLSLVVACLCVSFCGFAGPVGAATDFSVDWLDVFASGVGLVLASDAVADVLPVLVDVFAALSAAALFFLASSSSSSTNAEFSIFPITLYLYMNLAYHSSIVSSSIAPSC